MYSLYTAYIYFIYICNDIEHRSIGRSNDVSNALFVHLWFSAWPIERSHVAQKFSGGLPFDFAKKWLNFDFVKENSFV